MAPSSLDADVTEFLDAHIDSIPQLEILLLLHEDRTKAWIVEQIAARIYLDPSQVHPLLRALQSHRLVVVTGEAATTCFGPAADWGSLVDRLARAYRTDLIGVTRFVHAKAARPVLEFARAFDLNKKDRP